MSRKYTLEEVKQKSLELGIEFIDEKYINNNTPHLFICPSCKKEVKKAFKDVLNGHILCFDCSSKIGYKRFSLEEVKDKVRKVGCEFLDDEYIGDKHKHKFLCSKCKEKTFIRTLNDVTHKTHPKTMCLDCAIESRNEKQKVTEYKYNNYKKRFKENQFIEILTDYKDYVNYSTKNLKCHCLICNNTKYMSLSQLKDLESGMGCGCAFISCGERIVLEFLEHNGIDYEFQKLLPNGLYADFEIKLKNNKLLLLEVDGSQHYIYRKHFYKSYEDFLNAQNNDKIKAHFYENQGNKVLRIKYENSHGVKNWKNDDIYGILKNLLDGKYGEFQRKQIDENFSIINVAKHHTMYKKILTYTLDGKFYKEFNSHQECIDELKISNIHKKKE